jgi:hypothetical protein
MIVVGNSKASRLSGLYLKANRPALVLNRPLAVVVAPTIYF